MIIGSTYADAREWRERLGTVITDLAQARAVSACGRTHRSVYTAKVRKIYLSPNAGKGRNFKNTLLVIRRAQSKYGQGDTLIDLAGQPTPQKESS